MLGIHRRVDESLDVHRHAVSGHHDRFKAVHSGLDQHVRNGEKASLQPGRQADPDDFPSAFPVNPAFLQVQLDHPARPQQADHHQRHADHLAGHRRDRDTRHVHPEHNHQQQVQQHVDQPGDHQVDHRALCIPDCPQGRRAEVIQHVGRHADKIDFHIERRPVDHIVRGTHQFQQRPGHEEPEQSHGDSHEQRHGDSRMFRLPHQQVDQRAGGGYCRQGRMAFRVVADNNHVGSII